MAQEQYTQRFVDEAVAVNNAVLGHLLPSWVWSPLPHFVQTWLRNYLTSVIIYFVSNTIWCLYIYRWKNVYVPKDAIPSIEALMNQISAAMKAMPFLSAAVAFSEYLVESGRTKCFSSISEVGWSYYTISLIVYLILLEICIYWVHRSLHEIRPLYKYFHVVHHHFNKPNNLSPFAGIALHPVDGMLNSLPYIILPCIISVHFSTHLTLLFIDGLWTANTHDCIDAKLWPVMGAGYHTIHHTTNRNNYGHYTVWMDWMFGTLRDPEEDEEDLKLKAK